MKKYIALLLVLLPLSTFAVTLDSLKKVLPTLPDDTNKVFLLNKAFELSRGSDPVLGEKYIKESIALAERLKYDEGRMTVYRSYGTFLNIQGRMDEAEDYLTRGFNLSKQWGNKKRMGGYKMAIGTVYFDKGKYKDALKEFIEALKWKEEAKDTMGMADVYIWLGETHETGLKEYDVAITYYRDALTMYGYKHRESGMVYAYADIGKAYYNTGKYDSALFYQFKALDIKKTVGDPYELASSYNNIGAIYNELKDYTKALEYHKQGLEYSTQAQDETGIATSYLSLGGVNGHLRNFGEAKANFMKGLELSKKRDFGEGILQAYQGLAEVNAGMGDYKNAYLYNTLYTHLKDSTFSKENSKQMQEMQARYETEKKDLEIKTKGLQLSNANLEINKKRVQVTLLIASIVAILVIAYFAYNRYKLKKQQELDAEMIKQHELRTKAIIEAEEKERIRIAKDLHDGVGQQIAAVRLNLNAFEDNIPNDIAAQDKYKAMLSMVDDAVKEVRSVSHNMMPNALLRFGLAAAVREFIDKIAATGMLKVDLQIVGLSERMESTTETVLYRVLQETVSNIIKHAGASKVAIQLIRDENQLTMMIEDNGKGFDTSKMNDFGGIGLKNIISRVEYLNGSVDFDSYPGKGTTVIVELSVNPTAKA